MLVTKNYKLKQIDKCNLTKKYENVNQSIKEIRHYESNKSKNEYKVMLYTTDYIYSNNFKYIGTIEKNKDHYSQIYNTSKLDGFVGTDTITMRKTGEKITLFFNFKDDGQELKIRKKVLLS